MNDQVSFIGADLRSARFTGSNLSGAVMRSVDVDGLEIDAPWLLEGDGSLVVNGVDVAPFVDAELNARFPGREQRRADDPDGLRSAWVAVESTWAATLERVASLPPGTVDVSVDGEWSFAQTLRHLVMATDTWLRRAILALDEPYHPLGVPNAEYEMDGGDMSVFAQHEPTYAEVLEVRADRQTMVRDYIAGLTEADLLLARMNPWDPSGEETTVSCLHTILEEEWEHHRYAVRDLDAIARSSE